MRTGLRFLLWNLQRKELSNQALALVSERSIDILILVEHDGADLGEALRQDFVEARDPVLAALGQRTPARVFARRDKIENIHTEADYSRFLAVKMQDSSSGLVFLLIAVHLPSKNYVGDAANQALAASEFARDIKQFEEKHGIDDTIVAGDFNMNPFEPGMVAPEAFNAVATRREAGSGKRTRNSRTYDVFYNPCWCLFSDFTGKPPGTYHHSSGNIKWNVLDQVLLRPSLAGCLVDGSLQVLHTAEGESLCTKNGLPNRAKFSDHLPLEFELSLSQRKTGKEK
jgi:endonuclease/exonuclease/phosphatase family metal-dependent hydrolase